MKRTLSLKRETLALLSTEDLSAIVGGNDYSGNGITCPLLRCDIPSDRFTCRGCQSVSVCV